MDGAAGVLVVVLAFTLAVFLILAIVLLILLIRISRQIKNITDSAEQTVHGAEVILKNMQRFTAPAIIGRIVTGYVKRKGGSHVKRK